MKRMQHITGLLGSLALALGPIWMDATAPLAAKIAISISTALALVFSLAKLREWGHVLIGAVTVGGVVATLIASKMAAGTTGAVIAGTAIAVLTNLRAIFARDLGPVPGEVQPGGPTPVTIENPTGGQPVLNRRGK
jgi:alpha-beta hydrolase superfamily lysophospholipase